MGNTTGILPTLLTMCNNLRQLMFVSCRSSEKHQAYLNINDGLISKLMPRTEVWLRWPFASLRNSPYEIRMLEDMNCKVVCKQALPGASLSDTQALLARHFLLALGRSRCGNSFRIWSKMLGSPKGGLEAGCYLWRFLKLMQQIWVEWK